MELIQLNPMEDYPNPYYDRPIKNTALSKEECLALLGAAIKKRSFLSSGIRFNLVHADYWG